MTETNLTQSEADALLAMEKLRVCDDVINLPGPGKKMTVKFQSINKREEFLLDLNRGRIELRKATFQNRARKIVILVRLDLHGAPHRNPNDEEIPTPHIHLYREGFGDKWAYPVPLDKFTDLDDLYNTLVEFMSYCNITEPPQIQRGMFG